MSDAPDVIVIGAGVAGLTAAAELVRAGLAVTVLEARSRLGGRIHTIRDPLSPVPVELGAEFVHGKPQEIWRWIDAGKLAAVELTERHERLRDGHPEPAPDWGEMERVMGGMARAPDQSFRQFIENAQVDPQLRAQAIGYVEGFNAARAERIGTRFLALQDEAAESIEGDRAFRLSGGYESLIERLWTTSPQERLQMQFGAIVETVRWRRGLVEIDARVGGAARHYSAGRAIVTVPMGVLQAGAVRFEPQPEVLRDALELIEMGHAARITIRFRRPVCPECAGFLHSDADWMPVWWTTHPVHSNVVTGWTGGSRAEARRHQDPVDWVSGAVASFARLLGKTESALSAEVEAWHAHNWSTDPFALGAYSYVRPGGVDAHRRFGEPVEDTLYFAGEAVNADGHIGTVHGAIATGEKAAGKILGR